MGKQTLVELRSDTFTKPSKGMYQAMMEAEVGDSVYYEDPTINKLEQTVAELFGKEAALYMPTGTMANLSAVMAHCYERGCEVIIGDKSHYNLWEQGGICQLANVYAKQAQTLPDGTYDLAKVEEMIPDGTDTHCCRTRLICIENTHNWCGGCVLPIQYLEDLHQFCVKHKLKLHVDGSRIMNASVATGLSVAELCKHCDSINFCFSKALGAPIGSILIGDREFIKKADRARKVLGGGMRQAGVLAAACLYGLAHAEENIRLDHANAKKLAAGIENSGHGVIELNPKNIQTNIIHARIVKSDIELRKFIERLATVTEAEAAELGEEIIVKVGEVDSRTMRLLTHLDVSSAQIEQAIKKIEYVCREFKA